MKKMPFLVASRRFRFRDKKVYMIHDSIDINLQKMQSNLW